MGLKSEGLRTNIKNGINAFDFIEITAEPQIYEVLEKYDEFTVRYDRFKNIENLPFKVVTKDKKSYEYLKIMHDIAKGIGCSLLCSNGYMFQKYQLFNFVCIIYNDGNFIIDICGADSTLRHMYKHKLEGIKGSIMDSCKDFIYYNRGKSGASCSDIDRMLNYCIGLKDRDTYFECTMYSKEVGVLNQKFICWQKIKSKY